jgi:hypothetical protein
MHSVQLVADKRNRVRAQCGCSWHSPWITPDKQSARAMAAPVIGMDATVDRELRASITATAVTWRDVPRCWRSLAGFASHRAYGHRRARSAQQFQADKPETGEQGQP